MPNAVAIDTPDGQVGVVSAQAALATVAGGTNQVNVGLPPNVETLVVFANVTNANLPIECTGLTTGILYPGAAAPVQAGFGAWRAYYFDVNSDLDPTVRVLFVTAPAQTWYVAADSAARTVIDDSSSRNLEGTQYVIPSLPSTGSEDRPVTELQTQSAYLAAAGALVAASGAGKHYRVFVAAMVPVSGNTMNSYLYDTVSGTAFCGMGGGFGMSVPIPAVGLRLSDNAGISMGVNGGAGGGLCIVYYTTETD